MDLKRINIRKFKKEDAYNASYVIREALLELNQKDYPNTIIQFMFGKMDENKMLELAEDRVFVVAEYKGKVVGTATLKENYIGHVFVHPNMVRRGIGTRLMNAIEAIAKQNGYQQVELNASLTSEAFYESLGYKKRKNRQDGDFIYEQNMIKKL